MQRPRNVAVESGDSMIDVIFEHRVRMLEQAWKGLRVSSCDEERLHDLCRALRAAKLSFFDIDRWYGNAYDTRKLESLAQQIDQAISEQRPSAYLDSIRRHVRETRRKLDQRAHRSSHRTGIYPAMVA